LAFGFWAFSFWLLALGFAVKNRAVVAKGQKLKQLAIGN
jgi:hypothetical protein